MTARLQGGKTPPRLLEDIKLYNPQLLPPNGYNALVDFPPQFHEDSPPFNKTAKRACRHKWALKANQCSPTLLDGPSQATIGQVAAYCLNCRGHLNIQIDCSGSDAGLQPCPQVDAPLHHFVYNASDSTGFELENRSSLERWKDVRVFKCSVDACRARMLVQMHAPRLKRAWVDLLVDKNLIEARAKDAMLKDPERFEGHAIPSSSVVISNLRQYIADSFKDSNKRINGQNKKWLLSLGDPCSDLLHYLGFARHEDEWTPPRPDPDAKSPYRSEMNKILDDVDKELLLLLGQQTESERRGAGTPWNQQPVLATKEFQMMLGCTDYKISPSSRTIDLTDDEDEHPFYEALGSLRNFHDSLIIFCYEQQIMSNSDNTPYYLECLQGISSGRQSEALQEKAAIEASLGRVSLTDVREAFKELGLEMNGSSTEEHIIGTFKSRVQDAGKQQEGALKRALRIIGQYRHSDKIQQTASDTISTYEQALEWLGATESFDESFITTMFRVKVVENASNEDLARKCVGIIAEKRNSSTLKSWLLTGELNETEMDPAQAYARLNIQDETIDDDLVLAAYNLGLQDAPSQEQDLKRALRAIAKKRDSAILLQHTESGENSGSPEKKLSEWPVGLENIGNTCYLNSLLQFYFSVRPLRDLVLNFENFKMELNSESLKRKRVGSRPVTKNEVERAQKFVFELGKLFENMITANKSQISPERELARLTLLSSAIENDITRRFSSVSGPLPMSEQTSAESNQHSTSIGSQDVYNENFNGMNERNGTVTSVINGIPEKNGYASSEGTLVEASRPASPMEGDFMVIDGEEKSSQAKALENKENLMPQKPESKRPSTPENTLQPLAETSPSRTNEQPSRDTTSSRKEPFSLWENGMSFPEPPSRPPPVPPRKDEDAQKVLMQQTEEWARQQDVTEVIGNVLFQLECAIRAQGTDEDGEQIDEIKELFFGKLRYTTIDNSNKSRTKEEFFSSLVINLQSGPQDIYAAIDGALDKQMVTVGTSEEAQFTTISRLPPVLQVYPVRTGYDREKNTPFKVTHHLDFKDVIYMDRYLETDDADLKERRSECWAWKEELRAIVERQAKLQKTPFNMNMADTMKTAADYIRALSKMDYEDDDNEDDNDEDDDDDDITPPRLALALDAVAADAAAELERLDDRSAQLRNLINAQFINFTKVPYRLQSVFIHRGLVTSGHYWIYIFDFASGTWRRYNDGYVTAVDDPEKEIFTTEKSDRPATPMFLVYVREGEEEQLVQAVRREPREEETAAGVGGGTKSTEHGAIEEKGYNMEGVEVHGLPSSSSDEKFGTWAAGGAWAPRDQPVGQQGSWLAEPWGDDKPTVGVGVEWPGTTSAKMNGAIEERGVNPNDTIKW